MTKKPVIAFRFVLDVLAEALLAPRIRVRPMFGSHAVYVDEKIVFILRSKPSLDTGRDNGVWMATPFEHRESMKRDFPTARVIEMFQSPGKSAFSDWLNLPESDADFEQAVLKACGMAISGDPRVGKVPKPKAARR